MTKKTFEPIKDYPAYEGNQAEYERVLLHNLSNLSRQQLIDFAVNAVTYAEHADIQSKSFRASAQAELAGLSFAKRVMTTWNDNPSRIAEVLETEFKNPTLASLLRDTKTSARKKNDAPLVKGRPKAAKQKNC